jgi:hypothetical protein
MGWCGLFSVLGVHRIAADFGTLAWFWRREVVKARRRTSRLGRLRSRTSTILGRGRNFWTR